MSDIIHLLPDHIANQIAAGEVIQRPASVVKELMENAVDAEAESIIVNIKDAGRTLVQVIDDGKGMSETDARMAFERHATSKISTVEDLFSLHTMGFRGEALASIAAVAQVELRTRAKDSDVGTLLSVSGSVLDTVAPEACNKGSVFSIKNLFFNVPARRKFLKSNETEFRHILTEFERVALVHPHISFTLHHNESVIFELPACGLRQRIIDVFGKGMNQKLLSVDADTSLVNVHGFVGRLDSVKKRGSLQYFFVNGRYMRHPYFHKAVMQAYEQMIPVGEMPDYFIYFTLDPSTIDVNIHPTKTEIKFENERPIWQILFSAIRESLAKSNSVPSIDFDTAVIDIPVYNPLKDHGVNAAPPEIEVNKDYNPFRDVTGKNPSGNWKALYEGFENERAMVTLPERNFWPEGIGHEDVSVSSDGDVFTSGVSFSNPEESLFSEISNPCFQYKSRYIITPLKSGLVIIDQHRAHVRILYEKYLGNINRQSSVSQKLLFPEIVEFTAAETSLYSSLKDEIRYLGFDLAYMGGNSYAIHAVPADISGGSPGELVKNIITAAIECGTRAVEKQSEKMALSLAKATAIHSGKILTAEEMDTLVASLFAIEANGITPEGLPVLTILTDEELSKRM
ncbi:MAG: DNA mismatch repair endonuclease MutL [Tannerella sp.]|jgi:DNA mismatch repair protein MutL|nr:DNA mismatch repair endonuclease MutL [Tannerella sp.]